MPRRKTGMKRGIIPIPKKERHMVPGICGSPQNLRGVGVIDLDFAVRSSLIAPTHWYSVSSRKGNVGYYLPHYRLVTRFGTFYTKKVKTDRLPVGIEDWDVLVDGKVVVKCRHSKPGSFREKWRAYLYDNGNNVFQTGGYGHFEKQELREYRNRFVMTISPSTIKQEKGGPVKIAIRRAPDRKVGKLTHAFLYILLNGYFTTTDYSIIDVPV